MSSPLLLLILFKYSPLYLPPCNVFLEQEVTISGNLFLSTYVPLTLHESWDGII